MCGAGVVYLSTTVLEGLVTSLMSKLMPRVKGPLNAGLVATEVGVVGKLAGDTLFVIADLGHSYGTTLLEEGELHF